MPEDRAVLKARLERALDVLVPSMRIELRRNGVVTTDAALLQRCRQVMDRSFHAARAKRRLFVSDEELALRRILLDEILADKCARSAN